MRRGGGQFLWMWKEIDLHDNGCLAVVADGCEDIEYIIGVCQC